jgi:uncharacterized protein YydD (DUF2326 family)
MKPVRLYADKTFHNIKFSKTGLNVVIGRAAANPGKVSFRKSSQPLRNFDVSITEWTNDSVPLKSGVALPQKKLAFIDESRNICLQNNLQHIITLIDSDLPHQSDGKLFEFSPEEVCLTLSDKNAASKLFGMDF